MTDKFDLRRYLIENKVTTNSKLLPEIQILPDEPQGRARQEIIKIEIFLPMHTLQPKLGEIVSDTLSESFETYCREEARKAFEVARQQFKEDGLDDDYAESELELFQIGIPKFNDDMTACTINLAPDYIMVYIAAYGLPIDGREALLDDNPDEDLVFYYLNFIGLDPKFEEPF